MSCPNDITSRKLITIMAQGGAKLLVQSLKDRVFEHTGSITHSEAEILKITDGKGIAYAPKITTDHRQITTWEKMDAATLLRTDRALGDLWDETTFTRWTEQQREEFPKFKADAIPKKRVIFSGGFSDYNAVWTHDEREFADTADQDIQDQQHISGILARKPPPGQLIFLPRKKHLPKELLVVTADQKLLRVNSCTIQGGAKNAGAKELWAVRSSHLESFQRLAKRLDSKGVKKCTLLQRAKERKENPDISKAQQQLEADYSKYLDEKTGIFIETRKSLAIKARMTRLQRDKNKAVDNAVEDVS